MLTSDKEVNRDFDINNLFLNLDFQHQEETFEYKWPLLDHPSNYQMIITKLLTRTTLPYIKLQEVKINSKKNAEIKPGEKILFDYRIRTNFDIISIYDGEIVTHKYTSCLYTLNNSEKTINKYCSVKKGEYAENFYDFISYEEMPSSGKSWFWFDVGDFRNVYSLDRVYHMMNYALSEIAETIAVFYGTNKDYNFYKKKSKYFYGLKDMLIFFRLEDNVPCLYIYDDIFNMLKLEAKNTDEEDEPNRRMGLYITKNLTKFVKGLHFSPCTEYNGEFLKFYVSDYEGINAEMHIDTTNVKIEEIGKTETEKIDLNYYIFRGEKLNIMELSDYIGLAITSPDFPIKEQIYPQYFYDFGSKLFEDNRRHYVSTSELCIDSIFSAQRVWHFKKENVAELTKYSTGDKILFVKYFDTKTEDMNAISYENNNSSTTLKMDMMNVMPLKKFTLKLYLIDRYNNFEPLIPRIEGCNDVIKLQLLFTRIKGDEKENRNIIETKKEEPDKYLLDLFDIPDEEEEIVNEPEKQPNIDDILPDIGDVPEKQPNIDDILPDIGDVPIPNEENEEDIEPPPEKMMYINNENEEDDDYDENGLY